MNHKDSTLINTSRTLGTVLILLLFMTGALGQNTYDLYVKNLNAEAIDGKLYVTWTTRAGFSCQDIHIELSTDSSENFTRAATYFGICGDTTEQHYSILVDQPIANRLNYVRLQLGVFGYSYWVSARVVNAKNEVVILPHPVVHHSTLFFDNTLKQKTTLEILGTNGSVVYSTTTLDNYVELNELDLTTGMYIYRLITEERLLQRGRIMIAENL